MNSIRSLSTKGQVTIPLEIRMQLGLNEGDLVEFRMDQGALTLRPVRREVNAFAAFAGALEGFGGKREAVVDWVREMRDDEGGD